jgi:hypothetical protein
MLVVLVTLLPDRARAQAEGQTDADERVFHSLSTEQLEGFLGSQRIDYKKSDNKSLSGVYYYDFKRGSHGLRLTYYNGKDLMLDKQLQRGLPLDKVNDWNKKAKFSRASLHQDQRGPFLMLEYNLDLTGGVTRGTLRQFLAQFEQECAGFDRFIAEASAAPTLEKIYLPVTDALVEQVFGSLKIQFKKNALENGDTTYDFSVDGFKVRLYNYRGKDLMIDAVFRKVDLEALNKYNIDRKFVRAVYYSIKDNQYTALESNLDCTAGATEEMIRYFVTVFVPEVKHFANYLAKQP